MSEPDYETYYRYLLTRSRLAYLYRRCLAYPRMARYLSGRVLDVGCGIGDFLRYRDDTIGADINPHCVEHCRRLGKEAMLIQDGLMPVAEESFDGIVLDNVLEHIADPVPFLDNLLRYLRRGGTCLIGVPNRKGFDADPDHKTFFDEPALTRTAEQAGLVNPVLFYLPFASRFLRERTSYYVICGVFDKAEPK